MLIRLLWLTAMFATSFGVANAAGVHVPAGGAFDLRGGRLALADGDVTVAGRFALGAGELFETRAFRILAGGVALFGSGTAQLTGYWENRGSFDAGSSNVRLRDGAATSSAILGSSRFADLSIVSSSGKRYRLESGLTQQVSGLLQIQGSAGLPVQIDVTAPGSIASLELLPGGTQDIANVGVSDVHATGQRLAPQQSNAGGRGNALGWFGTVLQQAAPVLVPTLSAGVLVLLTLSLLATAGVFRRRLPL